VGGELVRTNSESLVDDLLAVLDRSKVGSILAAREIEADMTRWLDALRGGGRRVVQWMQIPGDKNARVDALKTVDEIEAGLTAAEAALADTGSLVLLAGEGRSHLPSLLPRLHLAILPASRVFHSMRDWLEKDGETRLRGTSQAVIITGPSRTADIEMTLTVGVHGPARLVVLLVKDE
ncbi:MAG TPA: LUD domain-containing protein, partial [Anaerolineales bacterium]|nr:LUD domain-containing protein [Anaerolineales bacterium]